MATTGLGARPVTRASDSPPAGLGATLRHSASVLALAAAATAAGGAGAWAQCTTNNSITQIAPFARASIVNSIVTTLSTVHLGTLAQSTAFVGSPANPQPDQQGAGSWSRVIAGSVESRGNSTANLNTQQVAILLPNDVLQVAGATTNAQVSCTTKAEQDFVASQFGFDLARHNFAGGGNVHIGLTGGYTDVRTKDTTPQSPNFPDGNFKSETQIPFAGVYGSIYAGNWTFDAQARWDWLRSEINDTSIAAFNQQHDARSFAFLWNAAYRFNLPNNWFIDPSIGGVWSRTEVDELSVAGTFTTGDINGSSPGFLRIDDVKSLTGRASLRVGTTITTGNVALQPFIVGSVFHEFAGNVRSRIAGDDRFAIGITSVPPPLNLFASSGTISTSRVGTYGHVGVGLAGTIINTGWLGYARFDYRGGDNIDGYSFNAGVRYQFAPTTGEAAGLKDGAKSAYADPGVNWTGAYLGYFSGVTWGDNKFVFVGDGNTSPDPAGYLLGGQVGYNYQIGRLVLGVEADYGWSNAEGGQACPNVFFFTCTTEINSLALVTGRLGVTHGRALLYVKGGLAVADVSAGYVGNGGAALAPQLAASASSSQTLTGWAVGGGAEFAFSDRWSAKAEYVYFDFGKHRFNTEFPFDADIDGNTVRVGVNYHFGHRGHYEAAPLK